MWGKSGAEVSSFRDELVGADICKIPKVESFDSVYIPKTLFFHKANLAFKNNMAGLQFVNNFHQTLTSTSKKKAQTKNFLKHKMLWNQVLQHQNHEKSVTYRGQLASVSSACIAGNTRVNWAGDWLGI